MKIGMLEAPSVTKPRTKPFLALSAGYLGLVVLANWMASAYIWHVPFTPYVAPAGVFAIGGILVVRDWAQQLYGLVWTMPLVYAAGLISWGVGDLAGWTTLQAIAIGSCAAFTASETLEAAVFTPIRKRSLALGVALSGTAGLVLDSWLFLTLAFGSTAFLPGQIAGKAEAVAIGVALTAARRIYLPAKATA